MKSIILARVSTEEQESNPAQVARLKEFASGKGYSDCAIYELEESSTIAYRKKFQEILDEREKTDEKIVLFVDTIDRLQRSFRESVIFDDLRKRDKVEIYFYRENLHIHQNSNSADLLRWDMGVMFARGYVLQLGDNVKRAFEQKRRNGEWTGGVRLGYLNIPLDEGKRLRKDIIIDPEREHLIKKMFELYASGNYSYTTVRDEITKMGLRTREGKKLARSVVENILKDPFYCGTAVSKKYGSYTHKYPRIISRELFDKCQEVRLKRRKMPSKPLSADYVFKGLLKCQNCGCSMSPEVKVKPSGRRYVYYSCTNAKGICKREYTNENELLKPVYKVLDKFGTITEEVQNDLVAELRKNTESEVEYHKSQVNRIRNEYEQVKDRDNRLLDAYLDQSITKDVYDKKHQEYADKLQLLEIELSEHREADYEYQTTVSTVISVARRARDIFENCSEPAQKRAFLNFLLQNPTVKGKKLSFTLASPFNLVLELADSPDLLRR